MIFYTLLHIMKLNRIHRLSNFTPNELILDSYKKCLIHREMLIVYNLGPWLCLILWLLPIIHESVEKYIFKEILFFWIWRRWWYIYAKRVPREGIKLNEKWKFKSRMSLSMIICCSYIEYKVLEHTHTFRYISFITEEREIFSSIFLSRARPGNN